MTEARSLSEYSCLARTRLLRRFASAPTANDRDVVNAYVDRVREDARRKPSSRRRPQQAGILRQAPRTRALALAASAFLLSVTPAWADSLFTDSNSGGLISDQIGDRRSALGPGALITVLVQETIQAEQTATTKTVKDSKLTSQWDFGTLFPKTVASKMDLEGKEDFSGDGVTRRGGTITMSVACQVLEILPDGSLRIKGTKELLVNEEKSTVVITGIVRPYDVGENNKVTSDKIAGFHLDYQGSGPNTAKTTPGFLTRVLNWLF